MGASLHQTPKGHPWPCRDRLDHRFSEESLYIFNSNVYCVLWEYRDKNKKFEIYVNMYIGSERIKTDWMYQIDLLIRNDEYDTEACHKTYA